MAEKYFFEYTSIDNVLHKVTIDDPDFVGSTTEINGYCELTPGNNDNPIECIKGTGLKIYLEASLTQTFSDLVNENERFYKVVYFQDSSEVFSGFLNPEGLFQDFVNDRWVVSLDVSDGLSFLENLSYVDDSTGLFFSGKQSELEIIVNCLKRTGLELNINTSIGITYTGQDANTNTLAETFLNADRFRKEDSGNTVMNCKEVICSVLEKYVACITQRDNEWYIFRPNELFYDSELTYYRYDDDGVALAPTTKDLDVGITIGSQINGFYPHWASGNQRITYKNSIGGYRINYKYGFVKAFLDNIFLESSGGVFDDYTVNDNTYLTIPASEQGVEFSCIDDGNTLAMTSDAVSLTSGDAIRFSTKFTTELDSDCSYAVFKVKLVNGGTTYTLLDDGSWFLSSANQLRLFNGKPVGSSTPPEQPQVGTGAEIEYIIDTDALPISGDVTIEIYPGGIDLTGGDANGSVLISEVKLEPLDGQESNLEGENHTFERVSTPSAKIKETKEIFNGDNPSDLYVGTIYEDDESTPTETWARDGVSESYPILRIMGIETLNLFQDTSIVFQGDVYGYFPYFSLVQIDGITGKFIITEYSYNIKTNLTRLKLFQIYGTDLGSDIDYTLKFDYGNVVNPTIKG